MFYSNNHEPIHVHILKDEHEAKYNVMSMEMISNFGFKKQELALIESVIEENKEIIIERWKSHFEGKK